MLDLHTDPGFPRELGVGGGEETTPMGPPHNPKYLDKSLTVLLATFTIGLVFARLLKQVVATLYFDHNYKYS